MEEEDWQEAPVCALCGAWAIDVGRSFAFGAGNRLCWRCATARGGRYDARRDVWDVAPDLEELEDEAYGAAPHEVRRARG